MLEIFHEYNNAKAVLEFFLVNFWLLLYLLDNLPLSAYLKEKKYIRKIKKIWERLNWRQNPYL